MNFPNAHKGISRILTAQWIQLICSVLTIVGAVLTIVYSISAVTAAEAPLKAADVSTVTGISGAIVIVALVFGIIAIIMNLIGINTARKDDSQFNTAFILCIISLIVGIAAGVIQIFNPTIADWMNYAQKILSLAVIEYVVAGIISLASQLNDKSVAGLGRTLRTIILILYCLAIVIRVIGNVGTSLGNIFSIADVVLELVVFIIYIVLLTKAKRMLA